MPNEIHETEEHFKVEDKEPCPNCKVIGQLRWKGERWHGKHAYVCKSCRKWIHVTRGLDNLKESVVCRFISPCFGLRF